MAPDRFEEVLLELDVDPGALARDPAGTSWLPPDLIEVAVRDPACAKVLAEFVELELELRQSADAPFRDRAQAATFTHHVLDRVPRTGLDARLRGRILIGFNALAALVAGLLLVPTLREGSVLDGVHRFMDAGVAFFGGWMIAAAALALTLAVVLPITGSHRRSAS